MTSFSHWYPLIGAMLLLVVLFSATVKRAPVSLALLYLLFGWGLGELGWIRIDPRENGKLLERITEVAVVVSLFTAGLKLRMPLGDRLWRLPVRLASVSMAINVGLIALVGSGSASPSGPPSCWAPSWRRPTRCWRPTSRSRTRPTATACASA